MSTPPADYSSFPADPDNAGWVRGWGVFRLAPWDFAGLFHNQGEAAALAKEKGEGYVAAMGSHRLGSDDFVS